MNSFFSRARLFIWMGLVLLVGGFVMLRPALLGAGPVQASNLELPPAAGAPYQPQKVVYHIGATDGWFSKVHRSQLANMRNHLNAVGQDKAEIVALMNGDGVDLLVKAKDNPDYAAQIDALKARGVRFLICRNTLVDRKMSLDALYGAQPGDLVPAGVAELARLEQQGYVYIKP